MISRWLRESFIASVLLLGVRLYLGWKWLDAGWHKLTGGFDSSGFLKNAIAKPPADSATKEFIYPNYVKFLENFSLPNAKLINFLIPWGEFLVGLGLILGTFTVAAAFFGMLMNFMFLLAGTVSSNPWLIIFAILILLGSSNSGRIGGDHYVLPYLRKVFKLDRFTRSDRV
jgi:thiosulfate dehydrogenase (quinone) large subunit